MPFNSFENEDDSRPDWMKQAEHEHPEILEQAMHAAYRACRVPAMALIILGMDDEKRTKTIQDCIRTAYEGMLGDMMANPENQRWQEN